MVEIIENIVHALFALLDPTDDLLYLLIKVLLYLTGLVEFLLLHLPHQLHVDIVNLLLILWQFLQFILQLLLGLGQYLYAFL